MINKNSITTQKLADRRLVGRTIVGVTLNAHEDEGGNTLFEPRLILDDGSVVYFIVQENYRGAEYGIEILKTRQTKKRSRENKE